MPERRQDGNFAKDREVLAENKVRSTAHRQKRADLGLQ